MDKPCSITELKGWWNKIAASADANVEVDFIEKIKSLKKERSTKNTVKCPVKVS
jgi:hypothetical protein